MLPQIMPLSWTLLLVTFIVSFFTLSTMLMEMKTTLLKNPLKFYYSMKLIAW